MTYAEETDIEKRMGMTINASSFPTTTDVAGMLSQADKIINSCIKESSNITDTYGTLKVIAINLVVMMINNIWYFKEPDLYTYMKVELSESDIEDIRLAASKFYAESWQLGE